MKPEATMEKVVEVTVTETERHAIGECVGFAGRLPKRDLASAGAAGIAMHEENAVRERDARSHSRGQTSSVAANAAASRARYTRTTFGGNCVCQRNV